MNTLNYLCMIILAFYHPTIDNQRVYLDSVQEPPYWLGVSVPSGTTDIEIHQGVWEWVFNDFSGTDFHIKYIEDPSPIYFYENGEYYGVITPEPWTIFLMSIGTLFLRKRK